MRDHGFENRSLNVLFFDIKFESILINHDKPLPATKITILILILSSVNKIHKIRY